MGFFAANSIMKISELDAKTGRFPTRQQATVLKHEACELDKYTSLLLMPDNDFVRGQIANIHFFDETLRVEQLEALISEQAEVDQLSCSLDKHGIQKASKAYRPFLWLQFTTRQQGDAVFGQFNLIRPEDLHELFSVEALFDYEAGVSDQNTWYPMFNALVDYIDQNSKTWSAHQALKKRAAAARRPMHYATAKS